MKAVANSSVLIALSSIGQLGLLAQRFPEGVWVPQAVWQEVVEMGKGRPGSMEVASATWITAHVVENKSLLILLRMELDEGEAEAIALCLEKRAGMILLDEKEARKVARKLGLATLGTVGILIWARRTGVITNFARNWTPYRRRADFDSVNPFVERLYVL